MTPSLRLGLAAALGAYTLWGLMPLYFRALDHISADHMLAQRVFWSLPTGLLLVAAARRWRDLAETVTPRRLGWLAASSVLIGINWLTYIWAVGQERVIEASLGYYINPLVNVVVGAVFFAERLRGAQWVAVGLATAAVAVMAAALGAVPWVSLVLCFSFAFYSIIRKQVAVDGRVGFVVETAILFPIAGLWLFGLARDGFALYGEGGWDIPLIIAAGPITATPLILFALAAKRLRLSTIGMMQYLGPTIQFVLALAFGEAFGWTHAVAFALIWTALVLFSMDSIVGARRAGRPLPGT